MSQKVFCVAAGIVFTLIAIAHLVRLAMGWTAVVGGLTIPMWMSGAAFVFCGYLAFAGFRASRPSA